ncbi:MAG: sodium/solute symporter, partial [Lentisphaeraceae bacterium]|nr:sodium/solute symporter [Lentisphaeraceae bacterium]
PMIGLALFATNISCFHLVSLAQSGFNNGLLEGNYEFLAITSLLLLGLIFTPFYIRTKNSTLPDFLEKRYSKRCRDWLAVISIVSAILIHVAMSLYTGGVIIQGLFGLSSIYTGIITIAAITAIYTIIGGLLAVVLTETIQSIVLILGSALLTAFALWYMGGTPEQMGGWDGWSNMMKSLSDKDLMGNDELTKMSMLRSQEQAGRGGLWWGPMILGYFVIGTWYWCTDQTIVQRVLGAKTEDDACKGPLFAGVLKILPVFLFVLPGLLVFTMHRTDRIDLSSLETGNHQIALVRQLSDVKNSAIYKSLKSSGKLNSGQLSLIEYWQNNPSRILEWQQQEVIKNDIFHTQAALQKGLLNSDEQAMISSQPKELDTRSLYSVMLTTLLPSGLRGILVAALLAALMSTVAGALNSIASIVSLDFWKQINPDSSEAELVTVGRIATFAALVASLLTIPLLMKHQNIFESAQAIITHIAPPITCVFVVGVFWKKASAFGAELAMIAGSALGVATYAYVSFFPQSALAMDYHFMLRAFWLMCICIVLLVVGSYIKPNKHPEKIEALVWKTPWQPLIEKEYQGLTDYRNVALLLVAVIITFYSFFK